MHIHRYEKIWLTFGISALVLFLIVLGFTAFAQGHTPAGGLQTIDPKLVDQTPPFDNPGVKKVDENRYEVNLIAQVFSFKPNKVQVPVGKEIVFNVTTKDVVHSFTIVGTNVNMMLIPGYINTAKYTFDKPGKYLVLCNEYCGAGHQLMQMEIEVIEG
ncbi:Cytochrome c oxidase subunit 2 [[Clostridium] ultunense Esp]|nr:Cytochrome c oxidase subunit 2 [[Clostridium] ultunense Esp]